MTLLKRIGVHTYGKPHNWSIGQLHTQADIAKDSDRYRHIAATIAAHKVETVLAPIPTAFNQKICTPSELTEKITLSSTPLVQLYRGVHAEGVLVNRGDTTGVYFSTADCATVVLATNQQAVVTHAGRDSLINRTKLTKNAGGGYRDTVIYQAWRALEFPERTKLRASIHLCAGIGFRHPKNHPIHGQFNSNLLSYITHTYGTGCLSPAHSEDILIQAIIHRQLIQLVGMKRIHITCDTYDTHNDMDDTGAYCWWSQSRERDLRTGSNGVLVIIP